MIAEEVIPVMIGLNPGLTVEQIQTLIDFLLYVLSLLVPVAPLM